jgi:hypothetical protein
MNYDHPKFEKFVNDLSDALEKEGCSHGFTQSMAILAGYGDIDYGRTIDFFQSHGGYCDYEILYNVVCGQ